MLSASRPRWAHALVLVVAACGSEGADSNNTGGSAGSGGAGPTGGVSATGGNGSGGSKASSGGSKASSGGVSAGTGGRATGGNSSGGAVATGGAGAKGGNGSGGKSVATGGANDAGSGGDAENGGAPAGVSGISIRGREILVDGEPFHIRGVNWNPVPKGENHPDGLDYAGFADQDIALMKAAGINAVRTYERLENRTVLDKLHAAGIYVFSTVYGWWQDPPSVVTARVNAVKDHPAILAWVLGNEWNYNHLYGEGSLTVAQTRDQINQAAALIKAADPDHPISTIYGEFDGLADNVQAMPDIDLWGINTYRGLSHGTLFTQWRDLAEKPMYLGEYGADAYDSRGQGQVDVDSQALAVSSLTEELIDNYATASGGVTLGGFVFEWADEWWKAGQPDVHDTGGIAPGGGPYPDSTFNEEYWGIVDIERNPRPAYDALKQLYAP